METQIPGGSLLPTEAQVSAKRDAEVSNQGRDAIARSVGWPTYNEELIREQNARHEAENARRLRFDVFATILSQRHDLGAVEAAEHAVKVYELLK